MTPTTEKLATYIYEILPFVIETEEQYDRALSITERLLFQKNRSQEEEQILDVWAFLIASYEQKNFALGSESTPISILKTLMESRELSQADLVRQGVGSSGVVSELVNGKREISKQQAKKLAEIFNVSSELFI
jgi:HTH-type transcriptional regulator/antitoxin HigA